MTDDVPPEPLTPQYDPGAYPIMPPMQPQEPTYAPQPQGVAQPQVQPQVQPPYAPQPSAATLPPGQQVQPLQSQPQMQPPPYPEGQMQPPPGSVPVAAPAATDQAYYAPDPAYYGAVPPQGEFPPQPDPAEKKKKTGLLIILIVVLLLAAAGGGAAWYFLVKKKASPTATTAPQATSTQSRPPSARPTATGSQVAGQTYVSPLGFSAVVAPGWTQKIEANLETFSNNAPDEKFAVIQVVDHGDKAVDPSAFMNQLVNKLQNDQGYRLEQAPQNVTYNGMPAVRARVATLQNGYQVVVEIFAVKSPNGRLYQIQNVGSAEYFATQLQLYKQFEQTFVFN